MGREVKRGREEGGKGKGVEFPHLFNPTLTTDYKSTTQKYKNSNTVQKT